MPTPRQPEKGARLKYQARYRLSVGAAQGMDDSRDQSMPPEEALAVAENVRLHDGIVVARAGQSLVSDNMDGSIIGMIETIDYVPIATHAPYSNFSNYQPLTNTIQAVGGYAEPGLPAGLDNPPIAINLDPGDGSSHAGTGTPPSVSAAPPATLDTLRAVATITSSLGTDIAALSYTHFVGSVGQSQIYYQYCYGRSPLLWGYCSKGAAGRTVAFDARATTGIVTSWSIDFGDSTPALAGSGTHADWLLAAQFNHAYTLDGTYTVTATLEGPNGITISTGSISVVAGVETLTRLDFHNTPSTEQMFWVLPSTGRTATFVFNVDPSASTIDGWSLDYGDGTAAVSGTGTLADFFAAMNYLTHTYAADGTYLATISFTSGGNPAYTRLCHVVVAAGTEAVGHFTWLDWVHAIFGGTRNAIFGLAIPAKDAAGLGWTIDLGDGTTIVGAGTRAQYYAACVFLHVYAADGTYTVSSALTSPSYNKTFSTSMVVNSANPTAVGALY